MSTLHNEAVKEKEAARILGISPLTLRKMRSIGPQAAGLPAIPFHRYSPKCVRYSVTDLEDYKARFRVDPSDKA